MLIDNVNQYEDWSIVSEKVKQLSVALDTSPIQHGF